MKNLKISIFFDCFFIFASIFFIVFAIIRYNGVSFSPSLIFSVLISLLLSFLYLIFILIKKQWLFLKVEDEKRVTSTLFELCFMKKSDILNLFEKYYKKQSQSVKIESDYLILTDKQVQVFFNFTFEKTPTTTVIESYKNTKQGYKTVILANEFSNESIKLEKDLNSKIKLCSLTDVYLSLKKAELLPEITLPKNVIKINKTTRLKGIFTKANSKKALLFGVVILLSSKLTFYPIYYIIFGSLLVILALTLRFYGKVTQAPPVGIENL